MKRLKRFTKSVWQVRQFCFQSPIVLHNIRALWRQSDPDWFHKQQPLFKTEEEADEFLKIIEEIS